MPTKTIYLSDEDQHIFKKAQEYANGNISGAVVKGLRLFVDQCGAEKKGYTRQTIQLHTQGITQTKHFFGRKLSSQQYISQDGSKITYQRIYKTQKNAYVLFTKTMLNWEQMAKWWNQPENLHVEAGPGIDFETTSSYSIHGTLVDIKKEDVHPSLVDKALKAESLPEEEYLDI